MSTNPNTTAHVYLTERTSIWIKPDEMVNKGQPAEGSFRVAHSLVIGSIGRLTDPLRVRAIEDHTSALSDFSTPNQSAKKKTAANGLGQTKARSREREVPTRQHYGSRMQFRPELFLSILSHRQTWQVVQRKRPSNTSTQTDPQNLLTSTKLTLTQRAMCNDDGEPMKKGDGSVLRR
jgi:hypothetical protein